MNFHEFEAFVQSNIDLLHGAHVESASDLEKYEMSLGFHLPRSMKWLLSTHGYSMACGIEDLENSIKITEECRKSIGLPNNILIINDWNDGGVVFAVTNQEPDSEYEIVLGDAADLHELAEGKSLPESNERFDNFPAWVANRVKFERESS